MSTYILVLFAFLLDGSMTAFGEELPTQAACEAKMQEVRPIAAKHPAIAKFTITCSPAQFKDAV